MRISSFIASPDLKLSMFDSLYFVVVTFSTVGYGDISPDIWLSRLYMLLVICIAFASLPRQIEGLISTYIERKKAGGEYSLRAAKRNRHVIVCSSALTQDLVVDFLNEFYAHPKLEDLVVDFLNEFYAHPKLEVCITAPHSYTRFISSTSSTLTQSSRAELLNEFYAHPKLEDHSVIVLCPQELDSSMQVILKDPKWAQRVIYMRGSSLKDVDLTRCHVLQADACFFLAPRPTHDKVEADRHTILRSWAVKDFAPGCKQYIQLFSAANKIHVKFAGSEGIVATEPWQQVYGRHSGNEIYHIQLGKSVFFSRYDGETFPRASADAHHRFGVALLAVLDPELPAPHLQLNPGPLYKLKATDFCFYMSVTREEYSEIKTEAVHNNRRPSESVAQIAVALQKYHLEPDTTAAKEDPDESVFNTITSLMGNNITRMMHSNNNRQTEDAVPTTPLMPEAGDVLSTATATTTTTNTPVFSNSSSHTPEAPPSADSADSARSLGETRGKKKKFLVTPAATASRISNSNSNRTLGSGYSLDNVDHRHRTGRVLQYWTDMEQEKLTTGPPPVTIYSGSRRTTCHIMTEPRNLCCLQWGQDCEHCSYKNARDERWGHQLIILAAEHASSGIFNFIVPLRSAFIGRHGLSPIVLLLEDAPDSIFLDTIAHFPLVYYMLGSIKSVDDLLMSGINKASHLVVANRDSEASHGGEETLADSETIVAVQTIFRLFPNVYVVTELSQTSNMRFMQFTVLEPGARKTSKLEQLLLSLLSLYVLIVILQKLRESVATNLNHIFRLPFAAGQVFSARMLDTLLYQTFVKGYLISFVRLLLGIDAEEGSGHLSSIRVTRATQQKFPEYGELYEGLCTATGEIPFAIYRTERVDEGREKVAEEFDRDSYQQNSSKVVKPRRSRFSNRFSNLTRQDHGDLGSMIRNRLKSLNLNLSDYSE
ncbi:hypothetical protein EGW08_003219, partial [Elysia chlorotica]